MSFLDTIKDILEDKGVDENGEWGVFIEFTPPSKDKVITIFRGVGEFEQSDYPIRRPAIQINVRGKRLRKEEVEHKILQIRSLLDRMADEVITDLFDWNLGEPTASWNLGEPIARRIILIVASGDVFSLGMDENERAHMALNLDAIFEDE